MMKVSRYWHLVSAPTTEGNGHSESESALSPEAITNAVCFNNSSALH